MDQATRQDGPALTAEGRRGPERIREDIKHTREQLGETAAALAAKADLKAQAKARVQDVRHRAGVRGQQIAERVKEATPASAGHAAAVATRNARENPVPWAVLAAATAGFLIGRLSAGR